MVGLGGRVVAEADDEGAAPASQDEVQLALGKAPGGRWWLGSGLVGKQNRPAEAACMHACMQQRTLINGGPFPGTLTGQQDSHCPALPTTELRASPVAAGQVGVTGVLGGDHLHQRSVGDVAQGAPRGDDGQALGGQAHLGARLCWRGQDSRQQGSVREESAGAKQPYVTWAWSLGRLGALEIPGKGHAQIMVASHLPVLATTVAALLCVPWCLSLGQALGVGGGGAR